jgi:hypothetical protein
VNLPRRSLFSAQDGWRSESLLSKPDWNLQLEFLKMRSALKNLSPLNDSCERALGLVTRLNTKITRDEESFQELIQVVEAHQKKYGNKTKKDLKEFY